MTWLARAVAALLLRLHFLIFRRTALPKSLSSRDADPQLRGAGARLTEPLRDNYRSSWLRLRKADPAE